MTDYTGTHTASTDIHIHIPDEVAYHMAMVSLSRDLEARLLSNEDRVTHIRLTVDYVTEPREAKYEEVRAHGGRTLRPTD